MFNLGLLELIFLILTIAFLGVNTALFLISLRLKNISNYLLNILFLIQQYAFVRILFINAVGNYYNFNFSFESYANSGLFFATPILLYLYTRTVISDEKKFRKTDLYHLLVFLTIITLFYLPYPSIYNTYLTDHPSIVFWKMYFNDRTPLFFHITRIALNLGYTIATYIMLRTFFKEKSQSIQINSVKKWLYAMLNAKVFLILLTVIFTIIYRGYDYNMKIGIDLSRTIVALLFLSLATYLYLNRHIMYNIPEYLKPSQTQHNGNSSKIDLVQIFKTVHKTITKQELYLQKGFNLIYLSAKTGISPKKLTLAISEQGFDNFSTYANTFKVKKAKALIDIGFLENYSIDALAEKSGFGATNSFYRVFKEVTGVTPKQYEKDKAKGRQKDDQSLVV
jgi:AraC-like DNA-binding protein